MPTESSSDRLTPPRRPWLTAVVLMSAVFVLGGIAGTSGTLAYLWGRSPQVFGPDDFPVGRMVQSMQRELALSPEQAIALEQTISRHRETMQSIHAEMRPKVEAEMESLRADVEAVLTAEQAKQWNERFENARETWMPRRAGWRGGGGPHGGGRGYGPGAGFGRIDANGDGMVSRAEANEGAPDITDDSFKIMDADGDGGLTSEEWRNHPSLSMPDSHDGGGAPGGGRGRGGTH